MEEELTLLKRTSGCGKPTGETAGKPYQSRTWHKEGKKPFTSCLDDKQTCAAILFSAVVSWDNKLQPEVTERS
ncbi:hypothetical protein AV530_000540 [Patagioenas fasciata monilis]|uniref:Uncharacterized protein n=1 Tax=Patagioenas fasciata monilis TaxID=372326 RepID=A0A1V4IFK6_PATFA|nr:hypothetical protein AV530_000540 [Patagioenas fasciata monilis]